MPDLLQPFGTALKLTGKLADNRTNPPPILVGAKHSEIATNPLVNARLLSRERNKSWLLLYLASESQATNFVLWNIPIGKFINLHAHVRRLRRTNEHAEGSGFEGIVLKLRNLLAINVKPQEIAIRPNPKQVRFS